MSGKAAVCLGELPTEPIIVIIPTAFYKLPGFT